MNRPGRLRKTWNAARDPGTVRAAVIIRVMVGCVFLSEGLQKFLIPDERGARRFEKISLPSPDLLGALVGLVLVVERRESWSTIPSSS